MLKKDVKGYCGRNNFCLFVTYSHAGPEGLHNLTFDDLHLSGSKWGHNEVKLSYLGIS